MKQLVVSEAKLQWMIGVTAPDFQVLGNFPWHIKRLMIMVMGLASDELCPSQHTSVVLDGFRDLIIIITL